MTTWHRSKRCDTNTCVDVLITEDDVRVRASGQPHLEVTFSHAEWAEFLHGVKAGEFDVGGE